MGSGRRRPGPGVAGGGRHGLTPRAGEGGGTVTVAVATESYSGHERGSAHTLQVMDNSKAFVIEALIENVLIYNRAFINRTLDLR